MIKRIRAFTIAEIVVAMLVLGAIALILMPVLYHDTEDRITDTALNKTYASFQQTARSIGLLISTGKIHPSSDPTFTFFQALVDTSKTVNAMNLSNNSGALQAKGDGLVNGAKANMDAYLADYSPDSDVTGINPGYANTVVLKNGVFVMTGEHDDDSYIVVDINGKKAPNKVGKDIFYFSVIKDNDSNSYTIKPAVGDTCDMDSDVLSERIGCTRSRLKIEL